MNSLVSNLVLTGVLKTPEIIDAFLRTNRVEFVPEQYSNLAYEDIPLPTGSGQTISQPSTVAFMMEQLAPKQGERVLDVGSGSGWTTAILSYIVGESGKVIGTERIFELVTFGRKNLKKFNLAQAKIVQSRGELGHRREAPYDKILVSASAVNLPKELLSQLKNGGRMVLPVGNSIWRVDKNKNGRISRQEFPGFLFVPLIE